MLYLKMTIIRQLAQQFEVCQICKLVWDLKYTIQVHSKDSLHANPLFTKGYFLNHRALQLKGVTGLPDNFPIQQLAWLFHNIKNKTDRLTKQSIFLLNGEVIWKATNSFLLKSFVPELSKTVFHSSSKLILEG